MMSTLMLTLTIRQTAALFFRLKEVEALSPEVGMLYQQIENHLYTHIGIQELADLEQLYQQGEL